MESIKTPYKSVLTIAGSDSGGCAGIQADIKSISACGAFAASVITATTAQNTQGVLDIHPIPVQHLEKQLDAVLKDIHFDSVKIGMLHSSEVIKLVFKKLKQYNIKNTVIDPVMVSTSGDLLINSEAISDLQNFFPYATLITPNKYEAEILLDKEITKQNAHQLTRYLGKKFKTAVLLKAGDLEKSSQKMENILYEFNTDKTTSFKSSYINTKNTHGTGCSLSSSIATFLGIGQSTHNAVKNGCQYIHQAIALGKNKLLGSGTGPINHFGLD